MEFVLRNLKEGSTVYLQPAKTKHIVYANNGRQVLLRHYNDDSYFHIFDLETGMSGMDYAYCALTLNKEAERAKVKVVAERMKQGANVKLKMLERTIVPIEDDIQLF